MKQRKHRGNKVFVINFQAVRVTGSGKTVFSPRQHVESLGQNVEQVMKGFMAFRDPDSVVVRSVVDKARMNRFGVGGLL